MPNLPAPTNPDYILSTDAGGFMVYDDLQAVGFQFVDSAGKQVFISMPGKLLALLAEGLPGFLASNPQAIAYKSLENPSPTKAH